MSPPRHPTGNAFEKRPDATDMTRGGCRGLPGPLLGLFTPVRTAVTVGNEEPIGEDTAPAGLLLWFGRITVPREAAKPARKDTGAKWHDRRLCPPPEDWPGDRMRSSKTRLAFRGDFFDKAWCRPRYLEGWPFVAFVQCNQHGCSTKLAAAQTSPCCGVCAWWNHRRQVV